MEPQIFYEKEVLGKDFKIYGTKEEPIFLALDVAEWIEHSNVRSMLKNITPEEKLHKSIHLLGQKKVRIFLTEDGLYEALTQSPREIAKKFSKKIRKILKEIRLGENSIMEQTKIDFKIIEKEKKNIDSNTLQIIDQREVLGNDFKIYGDEENPLFLAKDVASWIEHSNVTHMVKNIDEDERCLIIVNTFGGKQEALALTEDGLYEVLMQSRKPIAKAFKKEVKKILKQIRTTGGAVRNEEEFIKNYFPSFSDDVKQAMVLDLKHQNIKIQKELESKNKFIKQIAVSENSLLVREVAKVASKNGIKIGQNELYEKLREWGMILKNSTEPKQVSIDKGYFEVASGTREAKGKVFTYQTTRVTGKGQIYIINRLLKEL